MHIFINIKLYICIKKLHIFKGFVNPIFHNFINERCVDYGETWIHISVIWILHMHYYNNGIMSTPDAYTYIIKVSEN